MKQNVRRIVLLSAALALVGALVLSSAVFARGPEGAGTTPNQPVSQQQVQTQNQVQVQQEQVQQQAQAQNHAQVQQQAQAQNQVQVQQHEQVQQQAQAQNQVQVQQQAQAQNQARVQQQAQAQDQLQIQSTAGPGQQHPCSDCDGSQAQEGKACQNANIYGPAYGTGPIECGLFGPGPYEKCLDQDGICDCREWKGGFQ